MFIEEVDWCLRVCKGGWKVYYLPKTEVIHLYAGSWRTKHRSEAILANSRSALYFFYKHYEGIAPQLFRIMILA